MDIAALSTQMAQSKLQTEFGLSMMKKTMDTSSENANQIIETLNKTPYNSGIGENFSALA